MKHIILLITIFALFSCNKTKNNTKSLPAISQNGANTFGCKINGEIYSVTGIYQSNPVGCAEGNLISGSVLSPSIHSSSCDDEMPFNGVTLFLNEAYSVKTFQLKGSGFNRGSCTKKIPTITYYTDSIRIGELTVTRADNIIAGTFWFDAIEPNGNVVHITEGRFDITK